MILGQSFNKKTREYCISVTTTNGAKEIIRKNKDKWKSYEYDDESDLKDPWGRGVSPITTMSPTKFDFKRYIFDLIKEDQDMKNKIYGRAIPKIYTFDIEVEVSNEFPDPTKAKQAITTISVASPNLDVIVFGTRPLDEIEKEWCNKQFKDYMTGTKFFMDLGMKMPYCRYIQCKDEEEMLRTFLKDIVAKVPVLTGWNCIRFDWQYIINRITNYYPNIPLYISSATFSLSKKKFTDQYNNALVLPIPDHTIITDYMDLVDMDHAVLEVKESLSLDWIAEHSVGANKIKFKGDLQNLYETDFKKYVFYNMIDSILVQLVDFRFKQIVNYSMQALYSVEEVSKSFSKIALTEALFFKDFYEHNLPVIYTDRGDINRGEFQGAYVKEPLPGKYRFAVCNDFASLYPSTIITTNISIENYLGNRNDFSLEELQDFRKDIDNYFVSIYDNVYKTGGKEYAFKRIQKTLKIERNKNKYLKQKLDAQVNFDIEHILAGNIDELHTKYDDNVIEAIHLINIPNAKSIKCGKDLLKMNKEELMLFRNLLDNDITFYNSNQLAMKQLMNAMYGGCSHQSFYWFNLNLAADIAGEARNLTLLMEKHLDNFWTDNWYKMTDLHQKLGIKLKPEYIKAMQKRDSK